jgi:hypothetical protein
VIKEGYELWCDSLKRDPSRLPALLPLNPNFKGLK